MGGQADHLGDGGGDGIRVGAVDEPAGPPVDDDLGHGGDAAGHAGDARGHALEEDGGQTVDVAVGAGDERRDEGGVVIDHRCDLPLGQCPVHRHDVGEAELGDLLVQLRLERAGADEVESNVPPGLPEECEGGEEVGETLLLDEAADGEQSRDPACGAPRTVGEAVEFESVAHDVDPLGKDRSEAPAQIVPVEVADRDDVVGVGGLPGEVGGDDAVVEDVLRVRGERVRDPREQGCGAGHGRRHRGEVRVEVGDAVLAGEPGDGQRLRGVVVVESDEVAEVLGRPVSEHRVRCRLLPQLPESVGARGAGDVDDRGLDPGELRVEPSVGARAQGEDDDVLPRRLAGEDLGDDEGLGEPGIHLEDIGPPRRDLAGDGLRRHSGPPR